MSEQPDDPQGEIGVYRSQLYEVIRMLSKEQRDSLLELTTANIASLENLWGHPRSVHQKGVIKALDAIQFRLGELGKLPEGDQTAPNKAMYLVCIKCNFPIHSFTFDTVCPVCDTNEWLESTDI